MVDCFTYDHVRAPRGRGRPDGALHEVPPIKCPRTVEFLDVLPRTPTGKLLKRILRDKYWPQPATV